MEFNSQDQDIINLLTKLKNIASEYPEPMLATRRQSFLKQMTEVGLGIGAGMGPKSVLGKTNTPGRTPPFTSTLVETALIAVIVIEASAMAYFYREKLASFFETITASSETEQITPPSVVSTPDVQIVSPSPVLTSTVFSTQSVTEPAVLILTPTGTSVPENALEANPPGSPPAKGNNGNHYGQTPKPERTKTNNGNNSSNDNNGNNSNNGNNDNNGGNGNDPKPTKDK